MQGRFSASCCPVLASRIRRYFPAPSAPEDSAPPEDIAATPPIRDVGARSRPANTPMGFDLCCPQRASPGCSCEAKWYSPGPSYYASRGFHEVLEKSLQAL